MRAFCIRMGDKSERWEILNVQNNYSILTTVSTTTTVVRQCIAMRYYTTNKVKLE